jgi:sugar transferase (PEP-CTERM/EpsH1 system associated)
MRCLILSPFLPAPATDGGRLRVRELAAGLAARHEVHLLALTAATPAPDALADLTGRGLRVHAVPYDGNRARAAVRAVARGRSLYGTLFGSGALTAKLRRLLAEHTFDVVQCELSYLASHLDGVRVPWVLDEHNVEYRINERIERSGSGLRGLVYRGYNRREQALRRREELAACRAASHVLAVSGTDRDQLRADLPGLEVSVVPNGVDLDYYRPAPTGEQEEAGAVFVGKMDYRPNVDAVVWFCDEILPRVRESVPGFTFTIVGGRPTRAVSALGERPGVRVTGRVPDTRPYLRAAAVVVTPLRAGSGTRLKILEAMAMGRAVVSTAIGCEGLDVADGRHLLVADDAGGFAKRVVRLAGEPREREQLERAGRELVERRYGWAQAVAALEDVYARVLP